jgi:hypothetical protein
VGHDAKLEEEGEFVTTKPGDGVTDSRYRGQALANGDEELITGRVAKIIVYRLEVIEIQEHTRHRRWITLV